jgi:7-cyano-7-deazaguanine synthase
LTKAIVLLSGGIDSATALYLTKKETSDLYTLNFVFTQTYDSEAEASRHLAAAANVREHVSVFLPFYKDIENRYHPSPSPEITSAYVPARNVVFYGVAAAYAEAIGADRIVFGSNADDAKVLPDARAEFIQLMNELLRKGTRLGVEGKPAVIMNPLIRYGKVQVLRLALELGVPLERTWSCYEESASIPCGKCRGCRTRLSAFQELGVKDPLKYTQHLQ